jgi:DNA mismatch repair ATPase MutS
MIHTETARFYENKKSFYTGALGAIRKKINVISNIRLAIAVIFLIVFYLGFSTHSLFYLLPFVLFVFALFVRKHSALFKEKIHIENLLQIQKDELLSLAGDFSHNSSGSEFIDVHHPYSHDLDIFGESSLYQYLNRSNTRSGKKMMADRLSTKPGFVSEVELRQHAARELASKPDFCQEVQALSLRIEEGTNDRSQLEHWLLQPSFIYGRGIYKLALNILPVLTVGIVCAAFFIDGLTAYAVLSAGLQWVFLGFHLRKVNLFHEYISGKKNTLGKYGDILFYIRQENFSSELMQKLGARAEEGDEKMKQLSSLMRSFDARLNIMTNLFINSLLLYDLQCVYRLEKWKAENAKHLLRWIDTVHETEVLCSFGTFAFNHPMFVFPRVNTDQKLSVSGLGHPLLDEKDRVLNDTYLDPDRSIMIITGANMAGKSTFLRSLGVNIVLALAGAPACARDFDCPLIEIRSGMRTADSLRENQSYFFAELDRLKSIMDELRRGTPLLVLLDEILKGTNSTDKQAGSVALVKQLAGHPCLVVIATHDLALGDLEHLYPGRILNYSFEANIENDQLSFDYKLKRGIAQKMNATFLMRKMGIIPG